MSLVIVYKKFCVCFLMCDLHFRCVVLQILQLVPQPMIRHLGIWMKRLSMTTSRKFSSNFVCQLLLFSGVFNRLSSVVTDVGLS